LKRKEEEEEEEKGREGDVRKTNENQHFVAKKIIAKNRHLPAPTRATHGHS